MKRIIPVSGGKGGIGKSSVASALALTLSEMGHKVGLLDLDFCGPSDHVILGAGGLFPREEKGVIPPEVRGVRFMSIVYYSGDEPLPIRGPEVSDAITELMTITRWGDTDFLIIDMPPGIGDATLDVIRLAGRAEFLIISTASKTTLETVRKISGMLKEMEIPVLGAVENMRKGSASARGHLESLGMPFLGEIAFDEDLEGAVGNPEELLKTGFSKDLERIVRTRPEFSERA